MILGVGTYLNFYILPLPGPSFFPGVALNYIVIQPFMGAGFAIAGVIPLGLSVLFTATGVALIFKGIRRPSSKTLNTNEKVFAISIIALALGFVIGLSIAQETILLGGAYTGGLPYTYFTAVYQFKSPNPVCPEICEFTYDPATFLLDFIIWFVISFILIAVLGLVIQRPWRAFPQEPLQSTSNETVRK